MTEHTCNEWEYFEQPTEWDGQGPAFPCIREISSGMVVVCWPGKTTAAEAKEKLAFLAQAANAHKELLEACKAEAARIEALNRDACSALVQQLQHDSRGFDLSGLD